MTGDVLKIEAIHVRPVAAEVASRRKLYAALMLGGAILVAMMLPSMWKPKPEEKFKDSAERAGYLTGFYGGPALIIGFLALYGVKQLRRGRGAQRAAELALSTPRGVWMVNGFEVRPFDPPGSADHVFVISPAQRIELYRKPRAS